jgi:hypothetical protein
MTPIKHALLALLALSGCAPIVWNRPQTTVSEFEVDKARCILTAKGITPDIDHTSPFRSAASNAGTSIADGIALGIERAENFNLCMQANGYVRGQAPRADAAVQ